MVAMMATLIGYIYSQFTGKTLSMEALTLIGIVFAAVTGYIAYRGVTGSTRTSLWINVIQLVTLVLFSGLAIWYRCTNPQQAAEWSFSGAADSILPHSLTGVLVQSTLAILILVGFESCTALAAETKNPKSTIPKAIIISLVIQGLFAYLLEYFAGGLMISDKLVSVVTDPKGVAVTSTGMAAAAASSAPIGDMTKLIGDSLVPGLGFGLMITMAVTVAIAIVGTTLSCMNTAMRVTCGMAEDRELPGMMSFIHDKHLTPHIALAGPDPGHLGHRGRGRALRRRADGHHPGLQLRHVRPVRPDLRVDHRGLQEPQGRVQRPQARHHSRPGRRDQRDHAGGHHLPLLRRQRRLQVRGDHLLHHRRRLAARSAWPTSP